MGEQAQFVAALKNVGDQMTGLSTAVNAQGVAKVIKSFEGNPKEFKEWIKGIEKYSILTRVPADQVKMVAYQSCKGPVSDFLKRHLAENQGQTWADIKKELTSRFAEVTDTQYALSLLRKVKQRAGESIQVYAERLLALAEDAFDDLGAANQQLVGFFVDGLWQDYMKMKVMRNNPDTLQDAISVANEEQNLRRRFDLRSHNHCQSFYSSGSSTGEEPMEISHARPSFRCFNCNKKGHKAKECRSYKAAVNAVNNSENSVRSRTRADIVCWNCEKRGHIAKDCWQKGKHRQPGRFPGQATATKKQGN
ncbi:MAG: hypothetical protein N0C91_20110 [Candidatus Thiodiazotropha endolucinida]|nr:hypothetical protein [Candidatus Thiodiazotropha taylori]MCW4290007.1 hypothetical protein [Candidatus Thiodiazotropha endolucinida]